MSERLVFMMGEFESTYPTDRLYARNHMWAQAQESGELRFGFSAYAVRLLQDVYFLEWAVDAPSELREKQEIGFIESKKAESDLYSPLAGTLARFNDEVISDPSAINVDAYAGGWLFEMSADPASLMSPDDYLEHLTSVWEVTQRTIKGQLNE